MVVIEELGLESSITDDQVASDVFRGTIFSRSVSFRRRIHSESSLGTAIEERNIHFICENNSGTIVKCYSVHSIGRYIYVAMESSECSLAQAMRFVFSGGIDTIGVLANQIEYLRTHFSNPRVFCEANGKPTPLLIRMVKQILEALRDLHQSGIVHRDLDVESFYLVKHPNSDGFMVKIGNLGFAKQKDANLAIAPRPKLMAPEQTNRIPYHGQENDVFLVGLIVGYVLTSGNGLFLDPKCKGSLTYTNEARNLFASFPELAYLIKGLVRTPYVSRFTASSSLRYVWFWSPRDRTNFLCSVNGFVSQFSGNHPMLIKMNKYVSTYRWFGKLPANLRADLIARNAKGRFMSLSELVRVIRNYLVHYIDNRNNTVLTSIIGKEPEGILNYFIGIFPNLMTELYEFGHLNLKNQDVFSPYFQH
uniref:Serine/threonine-protein kinase/endoribonuclease IRE1b n=1 Tax=Noccaea caerulescens TaxID=107243 RepID=A0A1J3IR53_NOCCA